jgi:hypothetical protein
MSVLVVINDPMNRSRTRSVVKCNPICSLVLSGLFIWLARPSVAECALGPATGTSLRLNLTSAAGTGDAVSRYGVSGTTKAEARKIDHGEPSALNLLGIRYAKGQGVKRNPGIAMRFFLPPPCKASRQRWPILEPFTKWVSQDTPIIFAHMPGCELPCSLACSKKTMTQPF